MMDERYIHPTDDEVADALRVVLARAVAEPWETNPAAEWAAMEGIENVASAIGFAQDTSAVDEDPVAGFHRA